MLIANHLHLAIFESTPEVRVLCSAGITRPHRSYDPVRRPPKPPPVSNVEAATLAYDGPPPITRTTFPTCRAHYPGGSSGCSCRLLPRSCSLPHIPGGSASALSLSRPAQALLALRPAESLSRPKTTFVTRLRPFRLPGRAARQLPDQSTTFRMESSSTDGSRLRGAGVKPDIISSLSGTEQYNLCVMERNSVRPSDGRLLLAVKVIATVIGIIGIALLAFPDPM